MASERALSSDELAEFNALLPDAYQLLGLQAAPQPGDSAQVVGHIDRTVDRLRRQQIPDGQAKDIAFALGYLLGEQIRATVGWHWRYVTQDNGFTSYGVVSPDRSYVYFTIKDIYDLFRIPEDELNLALLFNMILAGSLPKGNNKRYVSLG